MSDSHLAAVFWLPLVVYSIILHEISHGWVALKLGDPTAKMKGRLTLNPIAHIDVANTILMPMICYFMLGFPFGGAKPVPVNTYNFRNRRLGMMLTAAAGPATNFSIALVFILLMKLTFIVPMESFNARIFAMVAIWNILLGIFNLVPIPPLDGSRVIAWLAPKEVAVAFDKIERFGILILIVLLWIEPVRKPFFKFFVAVIEVIGEFMGVPLAWHLYTRG